MIYYRLYTVILKNIIEPNERQKIIFNNTNNKLIVLKLPKNYDIEYFYNFIKNINIDNYVKNKLNSQKTTYKSLSC